MRKLGYRYVGNSPTNATDAIGLVTFELASGRPPSRYDSIWAKVEASYKSIPVSASALHYVITPTQEAVQTAIVLGLHKGFDLPVEMLRHYASNTGKPKTVNVADFITVDQTANLSVKSLAREAVLFADANLVQIHSSGGAFRSEMTYEEALHFQWYNSLQHFGAWIEGKNIRCAGRSAWMVMDLTYNIDDVYSFDITSEAGVGKILPTGRYVLKDADLAALHKYGVMRAFRVQGSYEFRATWVLGHPGTMRFEQLPRFPKNPNFEEKR